MHEFMGQDPVGSKVVLGRMLADAEARHCWKPVPVTPGRPLQHTCAPGHYDDSDFGSGHGKYAVVMRDGVGSVAYIGKEDVMGQIRLGQERLLRRDVVEGILCGEAIAVTMGDLLEHHGATSIENESGWIRCLVRCIPA